MNIVFGKYTFASIENYQLKAMLGKLVGNFSDYFVPGTTTTKAEFTSSLNNLTFVNHFSSRFFPILSASYPSLFDVSNAFGVCGILFLERASARSCQ